MGLDVLNKKVQISENEIDTPEDYINISSVIIPFQIIFREGNPPDIYTGEEPIPFEEKDLEFKRILIYEFLNK